MWAPRICHIHPSWVLFSLAGIVCEILTAEVILFLTIPEVKSALIANAVHSVRLGEVLHITIQHQHLKVGNIHRGGPHSINWSGASKRGKKFSPDNDWNSFNFKVSYLIVTNACHCGRTRFVPALFTECDARTHTPEINELFHTRALVWGRLVRPKDVPQTAHKLHKSSIILVSFHLIAIQKILILYVPVKPSSFVFGIICKYTHTCVTIRLVLCCDC